MRRLRSRAGSQEGLTIIELLVAIVILGVIFSGVAAFLINSSRILQVNERRVASTSLLTQLQEELQGTSWFDLSMYEDELDDLEGLSELEIPELTIDASTDTYEFEGREIVTYPGPDNSACPAGVPDCGRRDAVPQPTDVDAMVVDGREYQVARIVTWFDDRDAAEVGGTEPEATKRITTFVAWQPRAGEWTIERFDSERAASTAELGDPSEARIPLYSLSPSLQALTDPGQTTTTDVDVYVRLSRPAPALGSLELSFYDLSAWYAESYAEWLEDPTDPDLQPELERRTIGLSQAAGNQLVYEGTVPAGTYRFPEGTRPMRVTIYDELDNPVGAAVGEVGFLPNADSVPPMPDPDGSGGSAVEPPDGTAPAVEIREPVLISPLNVCVDANHRFLESVSVSVYVDGMRPLDYSVTIDYVADGSPRSENIQPTSAPEAIVEAGQEFERVFSAGGDYGFRPTFDDPEETQFTVVATAAGGTDTLISAAELTVNRCG